MKCYCLVLLALLTLDVEAKILRHAGPEDPDDSRFEYFVQLLHLAVSKGDGPPMTIEAATILISQARAFDLVARDRYLQVVWGMTNTTREKRLHPIRIPLLKGLLGYRGLITRPDRLQELKAVKDKQELAQYLGVQGHHWPDARILQANGLELLTSTSYPGMFRMLAHGRVDYFPRSLAEVWSELETYGRQGLELSPSPILVYQAPIYFFVHRNNTSLAAQLETGLRRAIKDGSFGIFFHSRPEIRRALEFLATQQYHLIPLANPDLPPNTPLQEAELWCQPSEVRHNSC